MRRVFDVGVGAAVDGDAGETVVGEMLLVDETAWSEDCLVDERVTLRGGMNKCPSFVTFPPSSLHNFAVIGRGEMQEIITAKVKMNMGERVEETRKGKKKDGE